MWKVADADLREEPVVAEELVLEEDLARDLLRAADDERAARRAERVIAPARVKRSGSRPTGPFYYARKAAAEPWAFAAYVLQRDERPRSVDCEDMPEREEGQGVERGIGWPPET